MPEGEQDGDEAKEEVHDPHAHDTAYEASEEDNDDEYEYYAPTPLHTPPTPQEEQEQDSSKEDAGTL